MWYKEGLFSSGRKRIFFEYRIRKVFFEWKERFFEKGAVPADSPSVLVASFWLRGAPFAVPTLLKEWWFAEARTAATDIRSCRHHERSRGSLRRRALLVPPPAPSRVAISSTRKHDT